VEIPSCHPFGDQNSEMIPKFLEKSVGPGYITISFTSCAPYAPSVQY